MLSNGECLFLTLTFNDDALNRSTADSRRQCVRRFLNGFNAPYVANIDFGGKNDREHYHAVICLKKADFDGYKWAKTYGFYKAQVIKGANSDKRLAKYISKLTAHAIKETCKGNRIIYSRD
jgi:hypothetical protein